MNENHIGSEFLSDDPPASAEPFKDIHKIIRSEFSAAAIGSLQIIDFAVARAIAGFELTMLVLTGRSITLVQRNPDK